MWQYLMMLMASCLHQGSSFSVNYYDCSTPKEVKTYQVEESCKFVNHTPATSKTYTLLQERAIETLIGFSCRVTRSTLTEYCGAYSHNKLARPPEIEVHHPLTAEQCLHMVNTQSFLNREIKIGAETTLWNEDLGVILIADNTVSCRGQPTRINNNVVNDILKVSQYKVVVAREVFKASIPTNQVEVAATHEMLPSECGTESQGCQVADRTYVWSAPPSRCSLERIRTVTMEEEAGYLIDRQHKILLKKGTAIPAGQGCPKVPLFLTEYPQLYLSETIEWSGPELGTDLNMDVYIRGRDDYVTFELEEKINQENGALQQKGCEDSITHKLDHGELLPMGNGIFMKRNGDAIEKFRCRQKSGTIAEKEECYDAIPIESGFVKPFDRVFTRYAAKVPCNAFFGLKVHATDGTWVEVNPHVKKIPSPDELPLHEHSLEHEDLSTGGIYTEGELNAWTQHIELGDYHQAITRSTSYQSYGADQYAPEGDSPQDGGWGQGAMWSSPWARVTAGIRGWGTYICLVSLMVELAHFAIWATALVITTMYEGMEGVKAFAYLMCCRPFQHSRNIRRRGRRFRQEEYSLEARGTLETTE